MTRSVSPDPVVNKLISLANTNADINTNPDTNTYANTNSVSPDPVVNLCQELHWVVFTVVRLALVAYQLLQNKTRITVRV